MRKFHFITGLPRSGSTLLAAILRQNPKFTAGMTSPVGSITAALRVMMSKSPEIETMVDDDVRKRILRGIFDGYYSNIPDDHVVFDTNRGWSARIPELMQLFPEVKMVATVRDPAWIFDSVETIIRKNPLRQSSMVAPNVNIEGRCAALMANEGLIGGPLGNLKGALSGPDSGRILLLEYNALCLNPKVAMDALYKFFGLEPFEHDFSWIEYQQEDFDAALRTPGLHTVKGPVAYTPRKTIVPPGIFQQLSGQSFWRNDFPTSAARVIVDTPAD